MITLDEDVILSQSTIRGFGVYKVSLREGCRCLDRPSTLISFAVHLSPWARDLHPLDSLRPKAVQILQSRQLPKFSPESFKNGSRNEKKYLIQKGVK